MKLCGDDYKDRTAANLCKFLDNYKRRREKKMKNNEYIDPLVSRDEMAPMTAEIKSESYPKISRLIQYLMSEYLVEDIQMEKVDEAGEEFYRVRIKYNEFPF